MMANNPAAISENGKTQSPVSVKEACVFLSGYASALLGCGATCIRIEKNVNRMAETFGIDYSMVIMPATVQMTVWDKGRQHSYSNIQKNQSMKCALKTEKLFLIG